MEAAIGLFLGTWFIEGLRAIVFIRESLLLWSLGETENWSLLL
jgi:hypothetical protein